MPHCRFFGADSKNSLWEEEEAPSRKCSHGERHDSRPASLWGFIRKPCPRIGIALQAAGDAHILYVKSNRIINVTRAKLWKHRMLGKNIF